MNIKDNFITTTIAWMIAAMSFGNKHVEQFLKVVVFGSLALATVTFFGSVAFDAVQEIIGWFVSGADMVNMTEEPQVIVTPPVG